MRILRATHLGMCFGVRDAIELAHRESARGPLTILGDLVHNETVLAELRARGIALQGDPEAVRTESVMITAHGASERFLTHVRRRGHRLLEATCPLVHHAHRALAGLVAAGFQPVVIGQRGHVEVRGLTEDYPECAVVLCSEDVERLPPCERLGVVAQTTQPVERVRHLVDLIRQRFPQAEVVYRDTVCQPTKQRQSAAVELAEHSDVVVVIGGTGSNNTRELVATCRSRCARVYHVQAAADLMPEWFQSQDVVGLTAGTSTPDAVIDAVEKRLLEWAGAPAIPARLEEATVSVA